MANFGAAPGFIFNFVLTVNCLFDFGQTVSSLDFSFVVVFFFLLQFFLYINTCFTQQESFKNLLICVSAF